MNLHNFLVVANIGIVLSLLVIGWGLGYLAYHVETKLRRLEPPNGWSYRLPCREYKDMDALSRLYGEVYSKIKGSIFLRIVNYNDRWRFKDNEFKCKKDNLGILMTISYPDNDPDSNSSYYFFLTRDMTFQEWLMVKGII